MFHTLPFIYYMI